MPSLLAALLSVRAVSLARGRGEAAPAKAIVALVLSLVTLAGSSWFLYIILRARSEHEARLNAVEARLSGKREGSTIERPVACDLVEEQLLVGLYEGRTAFVGEVRCNGTFEIRPDRAVLKGVEFELPGDHVLVDACLARATRWFVVELATGEDCPKGPWPSSGARTEADLKAEEGRLRQEQADRADRAKVEAFEAAMRNVRDRLHATARNTGACPQLEPPPVRGSDARVRPRAVDLAFLAAQEPVAKAGDADWSFMTSSDVRDALDPKGELKSRARVIRRMASEGGPYLVVYESDERTWPEVHKKKGVLADDVGFAGGRYRGRMILVDTRKGRAVCETPLLFGNSSEVKYDRHGLSSEEERLASALRSDLEDQFETAATEAIKTMTTNHVRLGYKLLE